MEGREERRRQVSEHLLQDLNKEEEEGFVLWVHVASVLCDLSLVSRPLLPCSSS